MGIQLCLERFVDHKISKAPTLRARWPVQQGPTHHANFDASCGVTSDRHNMMQNMMGWLMGLLR